MELRANPEKLQPPIMRQRRKVLVALLGSYKLAGMSKGFKGYVGEQS